MNGFNSDNYRILTKVIEEECPGPDSEHMRLSRPFTFKNDTIQHPGRKTITLEAHHPQPKVAVTEYYVK